MYLPIQLMYIWTPPLRILYNLITKVKSSQSLYKSTFTFKICIYTSPFGQMKSLWIDQVLKVVKIQATLPNPKQKIMYSTNVHYIFFIKKWK